MRTLSWSSRTEDIPSEGQTLKGSPLSKLGFKSAGGALLATTMMAEFSALPGHRCLQPRDPHSTGIAYRGRVIPWMWAGRDEPQLRELMPAGGPEPAVSLETGLRSDHFTRSG